MNNSAPKTRKGAPKRRISGVRPAQSHTDLTAVQTPVARRRGDDPPASGSYETLPAFAPIDRRALPFKKPDDRRGIDPRQRIPPHVKLPGIAAWSAARTEEAPSVEDLPSSLMPEQLKSNPPAPTVSEGERQNNRAALTATALLLVTALAMALAWLVWRT